MIPYLVANLTIGFYVNFFKYCNLKTNYFHQNIISQYKTDVGKII